MNILKETGLAYINHTLYIYLLVLCTGCWAGKVRKVGIPEKLTTDFRTDGYYYRKYSSGGEKNQYGNYIPYTERYLLSFYYENGSFLGVGTGFSTLDSIDKFINERTFYGDEGWGNFYLIGGDSIVTKRITQDSANTYAAITNYGNVVNDTTIVFTKTYNTRTKERREFDPPLVYHFEPFPVKPDSSNWVRDAIEERIKKREEKAEKRSKKRSVN